MAARLYPSRNGEEARGNIRVSVLQTHAPCPLHMLILPVGSGITPNNVKHEGRCKVSQQFENEEAM